MLIKVPTTISNLYFVKIQVSLTTMIPIINPIMTYKLNDIQNNNSIFINW